MNEIVRAKSVPVRLGASACAAFRDNKVFIRAP
jgi:hypothetical protein